MFYLLVIILGNGWIGHESIFLHRMNIWYLSRTFIECMYGMIGCDLGVDLTNLRMRG